MKVEQLSQRIGNVEESMLEETACFPLPGRSRKAKWLRRAGAMAAALILMAASFSAGALVWAKEPKTVTVMKEPETVAVGDTGISLILPEDWAGKYGYKETESGIEVYHLATREATGLGGVLFRVRGVEGTLSMDHEYPFLAHTIAVRDGVTYYFSQPSDMQYLDGSETEAEYLAMQGEIGKIKVLLSDWMQGNSVNGENWEEGTVTVTWLEEGAPVKEVFCGVEQSQTIRELVSGQNFCLEQISFPADVKLDFDGVEYYISLETGDIERAWDGTRAQLGKEDLVRLKAALEQESGKK